jgi:hypothetical protein
MKAIIEEQTYRELTESLAVSESDDAWHLLKGRNYIEWWYFDVMNSDESIVRGQFFISRDMVRPGYLRNGVRASYVRADGTEFRIEEMFPPASFKASTEHCEVEIGRNYFRGNASNCQVHIEHKDKVLDLELNSEMPGFKSHACFGDERTYMHWVVPQPRGSAQGVFRTGEEIYEIKGIGYRDHNWLNFSPIDVIEYWDWGRVYDDKFTVIFADIVTNKKYENTRIKPLIIFDSNRLIYLTSEPAKWNLTKSGKIQDPVTTMELPESHRVILSDDDPALELDLRLERVFQRIDPLSDFNPLIRWLVRTFKGKPSITSYHSTGTGRLNTSGQHHPLNCSAVHEYVTNV